MRETVKLLEENTGEYLYDFEYNRIPYVGHRKHTKIDSVIDELNDIKPCTFPFLQMLL